MFSFPKQHGAWAMVILSGLISFFAVWNFNWLAFFLFFAALLVFAAHHNFSQNIKNLRRKKSLDFNQIAFGMLLTIFGVSIGIFVMFRNLPTLWIFGVIAASLFFVHFLLIYFNKEMTLFGEIVGVVGLTLTSPMLIYALLEICDERLYGLWFLNIAYFSSAIFYVKLKVRIQPTAEKSASFWKKINIGWQVLVHLILTISMILWFILADILPDFSLMAIAPMAGKTVEGIFTMQDKKSLDIRKLGFSELRHSIGFAILVILSYQIL